MIPWMFWFDSSLQTGPILCALSNTVSGMLTSVSAKLSLTRFITSSTFSLRVFTIPSIRRHWRLEYCSNSSHLVLISFRSFEHCSLRTSTLFCNTDIVEFCFVSLSLRFSICLFCSFINVMLDLANLVSALSQIFPLNLQTCCQRN